MAVPAGAKETRACHDTRAEPGSRRESEAISAAASSRTRTADATLSVLEGRHRAAADPTRGGSLRLSLIRRPWQPVCRPTVRAPPRRLAEEIVCPPAGCSTLLVHIGLPSHAAWTQTLPDWL